MSWRFYWKNPLPTCFHEQHGLTQSLRVCVVPLVRQNATQVGLAQVWFARETQAKATAFGHLQTALVSKTPRFLNFWPKLKPLTDHNKQTNSLEPTLASNNPTPATRPSSSCQTFSMRMAMGKRTASDRQILVSRSCLGIWSWYISRRLWPESHTCHNPAMPEPAPLLASFFVAQSLLKSKGSKLAKNPIRFSDHCYKKFKLFGFSLCGKTTEKL